MVEVLPRQRQLVVAMRVTWMRMASSSYWLRHRLSWDELRFSGARIYVS